MRIKLKGLWNTRDLGGIRTADGRRIREKRALRSGALYPAQGDDLEVLVRDYHLKTIVDLRTKTEAAEKPDPVIPGVRYIENPILEDLAVGATYDKTSLEQLREFYGDNPVAKMEKLYAELVTTPWCVDHYRRFLQLLAEQKEGALLYHCSAGKDRVGTGTCLFLSALGVSRERIVEDYLETNQNVGHILEGIEARLRSGEIGAEEAEMLRCYESVHPNYLEALFEAVDRTYGSMRRFLTDTMQVDLAALAENYLER